MDLANQIPKILVPAVCDYGWAGECWCYVFGGLQDVPVLVHDLLDRGVVFIVGGAEWSTVAVGFWFVAEEAGPVDFCRLLHQGGVGLGVSPLVEAFLQVLCRFSSICW